MRLDCIKDRCYSPVACEGFGYCREMNFDGPNLFGEYGPRGNATDIVYTPDWCAADMVRHFKPSGKILEPCKGAGAFMHHLPEQTLWCEIAEGRDFFAWSEHVDWVFTNPPYSITHEFLQHAIKVADNIVFLLSVRTFFSSYNRVRVTAGWGGIAEIRWYGPGGLLNFPMGNAIGAIRWKRGHFGTIRESFYEDDVSGRPLALRTAKDEGVTSGKRRNGKAKAVQANPAHSETILNSKFAGTEK